MAGPSNSPTANTIIPVGVKMSGGPALKKPPHASTPHSTTTTTTKNTPSWLSTAALTPQQIQDEATAQANASVAPQVQGLQGQQGTYDAEQKAYQAAMQGFMTAMAPYMQAESGKVSDAYNSAAATMGGIAHGYAGDLGAAATADNTATNAALARGGQAPISAPGGGLTDAFAAQHGGIDGTSFAEQGAAKAADAANAPGVWAAQGRDSLTASIQKAVDGDKGFQDQIAKVYATVPALRDQIVKTIQGLELDRQKLADSEQNTAFNQAAKKVALGQSADRLSLTQQMDAFDQKYKVAGLKLKGQALQLQANKFAQSTFNADRTYGIQLAKLGLSQKKEQLAALAQEYKLKNGGFTQTQVLKFTGNATALADDALNGIQAVDKNGQPMTKNGQPMTKNGQPVWAHPPLNYQQAIRESRKAGIPLSIALTELDKVYKPGQHGRPFTEQTSPNLLGPTRGQAGQSNSVVNFASQFLGVKYVWGGTNPKTGLDCSGFLQNVYKGVGITIPRTTYAQVKAGKAVSLDQLQPGDAVFTEPGKNGPNHVGLYIGNGMVQESPHTGDVNKIIPLKDFLSGGFVAARRYTGG